jgi:Ni/Co efflux regulator RcnB
MMRICLLVIAIATAATPLAVATPAAAQTRADQYRWEQAQRRFDNERAIYEAERDRYEAARRRGRGYGRGGYGRGDDYRWRGGESDWDASHYYRDDPNYEERRLGANDEVYRGSDGRYYCRRSDGTTGLVIGAGVGALTGRAIDGGRNRATGTIIGGVLGALVGREVERSQDLRCR